MPTEQVVLKEEDYEMLKFLRDFFEDQEDAKFGGMSYMLSPRGFGRRKRINRKKINNTYVIRLAIQELYLQVKGEKEENREP